MKSKKEKCEVCGKNIAKHIHHIDRNRENNNENNLEYLCEKCHGKIHGEEGQEESMEHNPQHMNDAVFEMSDKRIRQRLSYFEEISSY